MVVKNGDLGYVESKNKITNQIAIQASDRSSGY